MVLCLIATFGPVLAHFQLNSPPAIGFDDDLEGESPCGGFEVDFASDTVTDFHIGGDSLAMQSTHPQSNWLFRATLDRKASGNWTNLLPVVSQSGLGNYCAKGLTLPSSWAGSSGVVQVVQHGPDSTLYQVSRPSMGGLLPQLTRESSVLRSILWIVRVQGPVLVRTPLVSRPRTPSTQRSRISPQQHLQRLFQARLPSRLSPAQPRPRNRQLPQA